MRAGVVFGLTLLVENDSQQLSANPQIQTHTYLKSTSRPPWNQYQPHSFLPHLPLRTRTFTPFSQKTIKSWIKDTSVAANRRTKV